MNNRKTQHYERLRNGFEKPLEQTVGNIMNELSV